MAVTKKSTEPTVSDHESSPPLQTAKSFAQLAEDGNVENKSRYAVDGNDLSGYIGVSEEYMTYVGDSVVDSPVDFDPEAQDNVQDRTEDSDSDDKSGDETTGTPFSTAS